MAAGPGRLPATGLGAWTDAQVAAAIRNGRAPDRPLNPHAMPWVFLHALTPDDALAIARYLKTLPPVKNQVPAPLHCGWVETVVAKIVAGFGRLQRLHVLGDAEHRAWLPLTADHRFGRNEV